MKTTAMQSLGLDVATSMSPDVATTVSADVATSMSPDVATTVPAGRTGVIEMIAHCIFHQTPPRERARCEDCGGELSPINEIWYCGQCLREREVEDCPICGGRPWN